MEKGKLTRSEIQNFRELLISSYSVRQVCDEKIQKIGSGTCGSVYKTYSDTLGKEVVLKAGFENTDSYGERLLYRKQESKNFRSPALLEIYYADCQIVVMEFCEQGDLTNRIGKAKTDRPGARALMEKNFIILLEAISELHERNLVHGDIKPANILVGEGGLLKLGDFGSMKSCCVDGRPELTDNKGFCGTPLYSCPELALFFTDECSKDSEEKKYGKKYEDISLKRNDSWALGLAAIVALLNSKAEDFMEEAWTRMGGSGKLKFTVFPEMESKILTRPQLWRNFISDKLKKLDPPAGIAMGWAIERLLEPDPSKALFPEGIAYEFRKKERGIPTYLYSITDVLDMAGSAASSATAFVSRRIQSLFGWRAEGERGSQRLSSLKSKETAATAGGRRGESSENFQPGKEETGEHPDQKSTSAQLNKITEAIEGSSSLRNSQAGDPTINF
ncbi:MAG: protein kinase [Rickettsiales bacterium]|jgi:serine/threonine protein kinase|nr:protein kinase [Rickettsiales bacterium]